MQKTAVIFDNDALVNLTKLYKLNIFNLLRNIYSQILIPTEVKNEYEKQIGKEPHRSYIINNLRPNAGFWALCTRYDTLSQVILFNYKGIDKGEAEIISQSEKIGVPVVISDDKPFKQACESLNKNIRIYNSLYVLAYLDLAGYLFDTKTFFTTLYQSPYHFSHENFCQAYRNAAKQLGVPINPKKVSKNTYKEITN